MPLSEAQARCSNAVFLETHPLLYAEAFERMRSALEQISPVVEGAGRGRPFGEPAVPRAGRAYKRTAD